MRDLLVHKAQIYALSVSVDFERFNKGEDLSLKESFELIKKIHCIEEACVKIQAIAMQNTNTGGK